VRSNAEEVARSATTKMSEACHWAEWVAAWWGVIGVARGHAALELAAQHAGVRYQGGAELAKHCVVRGLFGAALHDLLAAESLLDRGFAGNQMAIRAAAARAARAGERAAHSAQQVFGGYGYMRDYRVERCLRDAKVAAVAAGLPGWTEVRSAAESDLLAEFVA
jgi:alkylation response protein AidB-like acyl-CoA dehydrogenase